MNGTGPTDYIYLYYDDVQIRTIPVYFYYKYLTQVNSYSGTMQFDCKKYT